MRGKGLEVLENVFHCTDENIYEQIQTLWRKNGIDPVITIRVMTSRLYMVSLTLSVALLAGKYEKLCLKTYVNSD